MSAAHPAAVLRALVLAALLLAVPAAAQARREATLRPGDRVRLSTDGSAALVTGQVVAWDSFTLSFIPAGEGSRVVRVASDTIARIEVRERSRARSAIAGAAWGLFLGGSAGLIAGPFASRATGLGFEGSLAALGAGGGVGGALLGAAVGALWAPGRWRSYVFVP